MRRHRLSLAALACFTLASVVGWWWYASSKAAAITSAASSAATLRNASTPTHTTVAPELVSGSSRRPIDAVRIAVSSTPALAGTAADGGFECDAAGGLKPALQVRHRLDYYLHAQQLATLDELRELAAADAQAACGTALAAQQARDVWGKYRVLLEGDPTAALSPRDALNKQLATVQHAQQARRAVLGETWAAAFYEQDERLMLATLYRRAGIAPPASLVNVVPAANAPAELPDAQQRLAKVREEWDAWQRRLDAARADLPALKASIAANPGGAVQLQREWLQQRFEPGEWARVEAVLGL